ncbi:hypothetical protein ACTHAM_000633 [Cellulomonas soli]|uniref:hypothetical protein n=1 Tax=Cellulomonas soli TaxID=931535 RepID=UPI003F86C9A1
MVAGLSTGASATDRGGPQGGGHGGFSHPQAAARGAEDLAVGLYVYLKQDPSQHANWENSTQQYLVRAWVGDEYGSVTVEEAQAAVEAAGLEVCGPGEWGVQQDKIIGGVEVFTDNPAPSYPKSWIGWVKAGGNIYEAAHWNLDDMVEVPECGAQSPTPVPTQTAPVPAPTAPPVTVPTEGPTPTPTTPVTVVQPAPEVSPSATPVVTPAPSSSPTAGVVTVVLPAPSSVETKAPEVVTEVLAAGPSGTVAGAQLASTGAAPVAGAIAAVLLLAGGGVLLVLRRRGAAR